MRYIVTRRYKANDLNGKYINLPYATGLETQGRYIVTPDGRPLCFIKSQTAHMYFATNDDGDGLKRGEITYKLAFKPRETSEGFRYTKAERAKLVEKWSKYIRTDVEMLLFNHEFFCAPLSDLKAMAAEIKMFPEE